MSARRIWSAPLGAHLAALAALLVAAVLLVGPAAAFSSDESAVLLQARLLREGSGWTVATPLPLPSIDGTGPFVGLSEGDTRGFSPYVKHPLYPLVLVALTAGGGTFAAVLLSVAGTVLAALAAALLTSRTAPGMERVALWATGLASPLAFDSNLVIAHSLGAGLVGIGVWWALRALDGDPGRVRRVICSITALGLAVLLRSEVLLCIGAFATVLVVTGLRHRDRIRLAFASALVLCAATLYLLERRWVSSLVGSTLSTPAPSGTPGGRGLAAIWTLVAPTGVSAGLTAVVVTGVAGLVLVAALALRRRPPDTRAGTWLLFGAAVVALVGVFVPVPDAVSGFIAAFPLILFCLVLARREDLGRTWMIELSATSGVFVIMVLLTQYDAGGGAAEWGGRFLAVAVPLVVAIAMPSLRRLRELRSGGPGPVHWNEPLNLIVGSLVVISIAFAVMGARTLRTVHDANARAVDRVEMGITALGGASTPDFGDGDRRPVVLSTVYDAGRFAWRDLDRVRAIYVSPDHLGSVLDEMRGAGGGAVVLVSGDADRDSAEAEAAGWAVDVLAPSAPDESVPTWGDQMVAVLTTS